jgi:hypothetical protein
VIDSNCLGSDIDRSKISPEATITGSSYLTGRKTAVGPGAVIRDSRVHEAVVEAGATLADSMVILEGDIRVRKCDPAGRTVLSGTDQPRVAAGASLRGCTFINSSVGERTQATDTWATDCRLGEDNVVADAKMSTVTSGRRVRVTGPTELSAAWLGHHACIDARGYIQGRFTNDFHQLRYDPSAERLVIAGTIELPHVSRYGTNTICSSNSGKLVPQPDGLLRGFGPHEGLWADAMLHHEPFELGPCCWVAPWTKVIGQSPLAHQNDEDMLNDELATCVMPFAVAGYGGELTRGMTMPGELSVGLGNKQRWGGWTFTYAVDAVIHMVARLHEALEPDRKDVADTIVVEALRSAMEMTRALAGRYDVDLQVAPDAQRAGWPKWIGRTHALLSAHLEADLWQFEGGRPAEWRQEDGRWTHPRIERLLAVAPDALDNQVSEADLMAFADPVPRASVAVPSGAVSGTGGAPQIDPAARVADDAVIGRGSRIGAGTVIGTQAVVWNSVVEGGEIAPGARVERSVISDSNIGAGTLVRSSRVESSKIDRESTAQAAVVENCRIAPQATIYPFADLREVRTEFGTRLGGAMHHVEIDTNLMLMHMAGHTSHLKALPTTVELNGKRLDVPAVPMLGGGAVIRGTADEPVEMECSFIGSNAIVEPDTFVGFGCFVLGELGPHAGLPPFTVSSRGDVKRHQIGGALFSLSYVIITHFINWAFQAAGPEYGEAIAQMVSQSVRKGRRLVEWEIARRGGGGGEVPADLDVDRYRSLAQYSDQQLQTGLANYQKAAESGAWELAFRENELWFSSDKGRWLERGGATLWKMES